MSHVQSLFPVYLSRLRKPEEMTEEDYNQAVATNEDNLNQNLNILFQQVNSLQEQITALQTPEA